MNDNINRMSIAEFREVGFLQEVNRQFLHPLGLALEVIVNEDGSEQLGGIWDYRADPEGMVYAEDMLEPAKFENVKKLWLSKERTRRNKFGWMTQPLP